MRRKGTLGIARVRYNGILSRHEKTSSVLEENIAPLASKPVMLLANLASILLAIAGILQVVPWTIAGAAILAILSIATLVPSRGTGSGTGHLAPKKTSHSNVVDAKTVHDKLSDRLASKSHQTTQKSEQRQGAKDEIMRPSSQARSEFQKTIPPKIAPQKTVPTSISSAKPGELKPSATKQEAIRAVPVGPALSPVETLKPVPRLDPNIRVIERGDYATYDVELGQRIELTCEVTATGSVNVYLMDEDNLNSLDLGEEFWSEAGEEGVENADLHFIAPQSGKWVLVVENVDNKQVTATANIHKAPAKTPASS